MIALGDAPAASTPQDRRQAGQQQNVYDAERVISGRTFANIEEAQAYCDSLTSADWWWAEWIVRVEVAKLHGNTKWAGCGRSELEAGKGVIGLSRYGMDEITVLHEVAHTITPDHVAHGPLFVQNFLKLVYLQLGQEAYLKLYNSFKDNGVLID